MSYVLQHWSTAWPAPAVWVVVAAVHLVGLGRLEAGRPRDGEPARRTARLLGREAAAFHSGLLVALLALISPLGYWSGHYIWARSIQDLLLALVAPGLIVLGAPWLVLARGLRPPANGSARPGAVHPGAVHPGGAGPDQPPVPARPRSWLTWPVATVGAFNIIWLGWHAPALYDLATTSMPARYLEYACYLGAGILFWLQLIGSRPSRPSLPPMRRLALLIATAAADTILGMVLVFGSSVVYPAYRVTGHHVLSVLSDQQAAGAVLWMGVLPPLVIAAVALLNGWLDAEESDELSRDLDRVMGRAPALPAAPGSGKAVWHARSGYRRPTIR
jgi:putative membrane protein